MLAKKTEANAFLHVRLLGMHGNLDQIAADRERFLMGLNFVLTMQVFPLFPFHGESVSHAVYGLHIRRFLGLRLDLLANAANVDIDASRSNRTIVAPDTVQQMVSRENH